MTRYLPPPELPPTSSFPGPVLYVGAGLDLDVAALLPRAGTLVCIDNGPDGGRQTAAFLARVEERAAELGYGPPERRRLKVGQAGWAIGAAGREVPWPVQLHFRAPHGTRLPRLLYHAFVDVDAPELPLALERALPLVRTLVVNGAPPSAQLLARLPVCSAVLLGAATHWSDAEASSLAGADLDSFALYGWSEGMQGWRRPRLLTPVLGSFEEMREAWALLGMV